MFHIRMHPLVLTTILLLVQLSLFLFLSVRPNRIAPPDREYPPIGYGYYYVNVMRQAIDGAWDVRDPSSTRPVPRIHIFTFFTILGKLAKITKTDPVLIYELFHVGGGVVLFFISYWFICILLPKSYHFFAVLLVLGYELIPVNNIGFPFTAHSLIARHFGLPHHVWGEVFGLLSFGYLYILCKKISVAGVIMLFILGIIATQMLPSYMFSVGIPVFVTIFIYTIFTKGIKNALIPMVALGLSMLIMGISLHVESQKGIPFSNLVSEEKSWATNSGLIISYLTSCIVYIPFLIMLAVISVKKWRIWNSQIHLTILLCTAWILFPLIGFQLSLQSWFPIANWRLVEGTHYVPLGILSAIGLVQFFSLISHPYWKRVVTMISLISILLYSGCALTIYTRKKMDLQNTFWSNIYPLKSTMRAIYFLNTLPKQSGIMVREYVGEIIPGFADVHVFIDGPIGYPDWPQRQWLSQQFFSGTLTDAAALKLLKDNHIDYVFDGQDEQALTTTPKLYPSILTPIFSTDSVVIFSYHK
ncbi:MAG TPA: hypothetical protein VMR81_05250 [Patescibacteria group bacterium]|nr:hypothetical protein [Patescibacteria group bacterium]